MISNKNDFLEKLAQLCDEYDAGFDYTNEDDGIHIEIGATEPGDGEEVYRGWLFPFSAGMMLRDAKDK